MPWHALPFAERDLKVSCIYPTPVFVYLKFGSGKVQVRLELSECVHRLQQPLTRERASQASLIGLERSTPAGEGFSRVAGLIAFATSGTYPPKPMLESCSPSIRNLSQTELNLSSVNMSYRQKFAKSQIRSNKKVQKSKKYL